MRKTPSTKTIRPPPGADSGGTAERHRATRSSGMIMVSNPRWKIPPWRSKICWVCTTRLFEQVCRIFYTCISVTAGHDASERSSSPDNLRDGLVLLREMIDLRREIRKIADTSSVIPPAMPVKPQKALKAVNSEELRQYRVVQQTGLGQQARARPMSMSNFQYPTVQS